MNHANVSTKNPPLLTVRQLCYGCYRPIATCFCHEIPRIRNQTRLLILQHRAERTHPFNTARIVQQAMENSRLVVGRKSELAKLELPSGPEVGLLYPRQGARLLTDLPIADRPKHLVFIDATWMQARAMFRDVDQLHEMNCYRLTPTQPSRFKIRQEPSHDSLSTLEAVIETLRLLEPDLQGLDQLIHAFDVMNEQQLVELEKRNITLKPKPTKARRMGEPVAMNGSAK